MSFFNPLFAWGLGLIGVPIIIHLIFRQTYRKQEWAAMEFLLRAFEKTRQKLLLENLLLLLLRVLAVLLLVLAFMRPVVRLGIPGLRAIARSDRDLILIVDTSYSMTYRDGAKSVFDKAIEQGLEFVTRLDGKGSVALLTASDRPEVLLEYTPNHETVAKTLKGIKPTGGATDIAASLRKVHELISDPRFRARGRKRVVLLTDLTRNGWVVKGRKVEGVSSVLEKLATKVDEFLLVDLGKRRPELNLSVDKLYSADKIVGQNLPAQFLATISNRGSKPVHGVKVHFLLAGAKRETKVIRTLPPRQSRDVVFSEVFPKSGPTYVTVEVEGDQHLVVDNRRHHAFEVVDKIKVLLVDGDVQKWSELADTHYLASALAPQISNNNAIRHIFEPRQVDRQQFHRTKLVGSGYDVVVLSNVSYLSEEKEIELEQFVKLGGGLLIFLGDEIRPDIYNKRLFEKRKILPGKLASKPFGDVAEGEPKYQLLPVNYTHPLFLFFRDFQYMFNGLKQNTALVGMFYPVTPDKAPQVTVLARYSDAKSSPAIIERQLGLGKVLLVTTSADGDWQRLVDSDVYLPLVHETIYYLISRLSAARNLLVHAPIEFSMRARYTAVRVARPEASGDPRREAAKQPRPQANGVFRYSQTDQSGVYRVELDSLSTSATGQAQTEKTIAYYGIGVDPAEGDLEHLGQSGLIKRYPALGNRPYHFSKSARALGLGSGLQKEGEVWHLLLLLGLICLISESILAMWMGRK